MTNVKYDEIEKNVKKLLNKSEAYDKKFEQIESRLTLVEYQVVEIQKKLETEATKIVSENKLSSIVPEPSKGEKEYLQSLLNDKIVEPWSINLDKAKQETLDGLVDLLADSVIKVYNWNQEDKKISKTDHEKFLKSFIDQLVDSSFKGNSDSNPKLMAVETGVKALVIGSKYMIAKFEEQKKVKELEEYWNKKKLHSIKDEIKKHLKDESYSGLTNMMDDFCNLYKINFDRDDCGVDKSFLNEIDILNNKMSTLEKGIIIVDKSLYVNFIRSFSKIDYSHEKHIEIKEVSELKKICESIDRNLENFSKFNLENYTKDEISEDEINKLNSQFRLYRAIKKTGEFVEQPYSNNFFYYAQEILAFSNTNTFRILTFFLPIGLAHQTEHSGFDQNLLNSRSLRNNLSKLKEMMRECMFGFSSETLNYVLKKREILSHIKIFSDITGSKYAQNFYQKCLDDSYEGIEEKKLFDELYDLYYKVTNTGLANPENHYKYSFGLQEIKSPEKENPAYQFVLSAIERNKNKTNKLVKSTANDNSVNQDQKDNAIEKNKNKTNESVKSANDNSVNQDQEDGLFILQQVGTAVTKAFSQKN